MRLRSIVSRPAYGRRGALERAWSAASGRESDAAVGPATRRLDLASALVVARLADGQALATACAAAFYRGNRSPTASGG